MIINGVQLDFSPLNYKHLEKYESAKKVCAEKYSFLLQDTGNKTPAEVIKAGIEFFGDFFDEIFGAGTSNKLFGSETDFEKVFDVYTQFVNGVEEVSRNAYAKFIPYLPDAAVP